MSNTTARGTMFAELCDVLGFPKPLIDHWLKYKKNKLDALNRGAELLADAGVPPSSMSQMLDTWKVTDWKGKKGEQPDVGEFSEWAVRHWLGLHRTQKELKKLDVATPRWQGKHDHLRVARAQLEQDRATRTIQQKEWQALAEEFAKAGRLSGAARIKTKGKRDEQESNHGYRLGSKHVGCSKKASRTNRREQRG